MNMDIDLINRQLTWHPEVKWSFLHKTGDQENADKIKKILIRFAQIPRTITEKEFKEKKKSYRSVKHSLYKQYHRELPDMYINTESTKYSEKNITFYPDYRSFKNWCLDNGHIRQYIGNGEIEIYEDDAKPF